MTTRSLTPTPPSAAESDQARRNRYHHGDLAQALLAAVRVLIERDGADAMSVSEACRMAGVSTAAPYKHFADRHDILRHLCRQGFEELDAATAAASRSIEAVGPARVAAIGKAYVAFAVANPGLFRVMFGMKTELMDPDSEYGREAQACFATVTHDVAEAAGHEVESPEAKSLAVMLWTFVHGAATLSLDGHYAVSDVPVNTDAMIELAAEGLLRGAADRA